MECLGRSLVVGNGQYVTRFVGMSQWVAGWLGEKMGTAGFVGISGICNSHRLSGPL